MKSSLAWVYALHRWGGLLTGWLLLVICLTGTLVVYKYPLKSWSNPTLVDGPKQVVLTPDEALARFIERYPDSTPSRFSLPSDVYSIQSYTYSLPGARHIVTGRAWMNPRSGEIHEGLPSDFADFVQALHSDLWMGNEGRWTVGVLGVLMMISLMSGLALHWKRLGRDLFQLRLNQGSRKAWSDVHKVGAVWLFVFHLIIVATGAWLGLEKWISIHNRPPVISLGDDTDIQPMPSVQSLVKVAQHEHPELIPTHLNFAAYGLAGSSVRIQGELPGWALVQRGQTMVVLDTQDSSTLDVIDRRDEGLIARVLAMVRPLHYGYFGGRWMELAYFLMGAVCTALVFSGLAVWCGRENDAATRRAQNNGQQRTHDLRMARLNVAVTMGLLLVLLLAAHVAQLRWTTLGAEMLGHGRLGRFGGSHKIFLGVTPTPELWPTLAAWLLCGTVLYRFRRTQDAWRIGWGALALLLATLPVSSAWAAGGWWSDWRSGQGEGLWIATVCWAWAALICSALWLRRRPRVHISKNIN